jgi:hypothetical protein
MLLADATDLTGVASIVGAVVNVGFAGVVGWYLLTKAIPSMQKDFKEELNKERQHSENMDTRRRDEHKDALIVVTKHCETESARRDAAFEQYSGLVTAALNDNREVLEQVRDVLRWLKSNVEKPPPTWPPADKLGERKT